LVQAPSTSPYDEIAGLYDAWWADWYLPAAMPALERLFFTQVGAGARVLDLCCGSGHVTKDLVRRGYQVTGIDNSTELIALARKRLPDTDLRVQDARNLALDERYDAALSTFDSLNHFLNIRDLQQVFVGLHRALKPGARFVFDMNLDEAYALDLHRWSVEIKDTSVGLVRGDFDRVSKKARTELIWFARNEQSGCWRQHKSVVEQRCYPEPEIVQALRTAGFQAIESVASADAGITSDLGFGRLFFVAHAQE
jgi:SAM-dependent methyltransferase